MDENKTAAEEVQTSLFSPPTKEETIESIKRRFNDFAEVQNGSEYCIADMQQSLDRLYNTIADGGTPEQIAAACNTAAAKMEAIADKENDNALKGIAQAISMFADKVCPNMQRPKTHVFHGEKCFILPDEIEEYRKVNPVGAAAHEKQEVQEAKREAAIKLSFNADGAKSIEDMTPEELKAAVAEYTREQDKVRKIITEYANSIAGKGVDNIVAGVTEALQQAKVPLTDLTYNILSFMQSETMEQFSSMLSTLSKWYGDISAQFEAGDFSFLSAYFENIDDITPLLKGQLEKYKKDHGIENLTLSEFLRNIDPETGNPVESIFAQCVNEITGDSTAYTTLHADFTELPLLRSIIPDKHTMPNNALMNKLQKAQAINAGEFDLPVANENGKRREITAAVKVDYDETQTGIKLTGANMTEYERQVSDAVITLWLYGDDNHLMTADMIYRAMTGQSSGGKATQGQKSAIAKFMNKWGSVRIFVDCSEEMRKRGITDKSGKPINKFSFDEYYLNTRRELAKVGRETVTAWRLLSKPVILTYSEMTNQLLTVPPKLLDIKEVNAGGVATTVSVSNNDTRIAIKGNLLRSIQVMKGKKRNKQEWSNIIAFDKLFDETGLTGTSKTVQKDARDYAFICLDYWKAERFIIDYKKRTKGRTITGVEIVL